MPARRAPFDHASCEVDRTLSLHSPWRRLPADSGLDSEILWRLALDGLSPSLAARLACFRMPTGSCQAYLRKNSSKPEKPWPTASQLLGIAHPKSR